MRAARRCGGSESGARLALEHPVWADLSLPTPLSAAAGPLWIGVITGSQSSIASFRWDNVPGSRAVNTNTYAGGPSDPFGPISSDAEQMSLNATYG